jgi:hypothetical protein
MHPPDLRPLEFGEILDGAFALYRRNFAAFLVMSAVPLTPVLACQILLAAGGVDHAGAWQLLGLVGGFLAVLATGALIRATADAYGGVPVDSRRALATARARYWTQLRAVVVAGLVTMAGFFLFIVPGIIASINYFAVGQAAVLEDTTSSEARHRSSHLSQGAGGRILGMMAVLTVISWLPALSQALFADWMGSGYADSGLGGIAAQLLQILALPLTTAAYTLLYFDRRIRVDAMDVQVAMQRMAAEE